MSRLPNPDVYLNHLPPEAAAQFEATRNLCLAVLGAMIWDILIYIPEDLRILFHGPFHAVTVCFFTSRLFALLFLLLSTIEHTRPVADCHAMTISIGIMIVLASTSASYLFLQRLRAVYAENRYVQAAFTFLWIAVFASMTVVIYGQEATHLPGTGYCVITHVEKYLSASAFVCGVYDTAIFIAISYKLASSHSYTDAGVSWDTLVSGRALPRLSRSILQGGQQYYLIVSVLNLPMGVLTVIPQVPPIAKSILTFPFLPLTASMTCRVFRNIKIQEEMRQMGRSFLSDINFATRPEVAPKSLARPPNINVHVEKSTFSPTLPTDFSSSLEAEDQSATMQSGSAAGHSC